MELVNAAAY